MAIEYKTESLANLEATIDSVATGSIMNCDNDVDDTNVIHGEFMDGTVGVLEGSFIHLADGQSIKVVQMTSSLEDGVNVVQVETTELGEHDMTTVEEFCEVDIDGVEDASHILHEPGAHVIVRTENHLPSSPLGNAHRQGSSQYDGTMSASSSALPQVPFSFPGQTFDAKCQKLILNVWDFFRRVKKNPDLLDEIRTPQERAAAALHISAATIGKIGKNFKRTGKLEVPNRRRKRTKPVVDSVDADQEQTIRSIIKEFKDSRIVPTLPLILNECRERISFTGGTTSFRRILHRMGYKGMANITGPLTSGSNNSKQKSSNVSSSSFTNKASKPLMSPDKIKSEQDTDSYISIPLTTTEMPRLPLYKKSPVKSRASTSTSSLSTQKRSSSPKPLGLSKQEASNLMTNLLGDNIFQLKGETLTLSQETAAAITNASGGMDGPQTIHVLQPDNTIQQIQIVYADV